LNALPLCSTVNLMDRSAAELAIRALETERQKIDAAIRELRAMVTDEPPAARSVRRKRISRAGLRKTSEGANRRRAKVHEAAPSNAVPARSQKKSAQKKGGLTPEGRARLAEATRQRNIARAAAAKKAAAKAS